MLLSHFTTIEANSFVANIAALWQAGKKERVSSAETLYCLAPPARLERATL